MGGKDVIYLKQLQSSNLEPTEVQNLLKQLADEQLSEHVSEASISGSDKSLKNKVFFKCILVELLFGSGNYIPRP